MTEDCQIIVNGSEVTTRAEYVSFLGVVQAAFPDFQRDTKRYTVTFTKGWNYRPQGTLTPGDMVAVRDGMIFNVVDTSRA